jgi:hypothetical protein
LFAVVTLAGAHHPRTGGDLRQLAIIEDGRSWCAASSSKLSAGGAKSKT